MSFESPITKLLSHIITLKVSDVFVSEGKIPYVRLNGEVCPLSQHPIITQNEMVDFLTHILQPKVYELFQKSGDLDLGYSLDHQHRLRLNIARQKGLLSIVARPLTSGAFEFEELGIPKIVQDWIQNKAGLILVVGATGSGKSTIINLLLRFYEINSGEIYVGKWGIKSFDISYLRSNIGVIHQDPFLFSDTILNNIIFSNNQSKENVISSIKEIGLMDIINSFPNGLEFHVGEEGKNLSLGQRQIISFLRVYMSNPELIIFDEATSSLDSNTEELIKKAINKFSYSKTCIIIAHRLSTIKNANRIIFLKNGKIMEDGTHEDLLSKKGYYSDLYNKQWMDYFK